jgi:hypothetical protein
MLLRETVAVYCENQMEHTDTLCEQNAVYINSVRTSQEIHDVTANGAQPVNAVYCENHMEHTDTLCGQTAEFFNHFRPDWLTAKLQLAIATWTVLQGGWCLGNWTRFCFKVRGAWFCRANYMTLSVAVKKWPRTNQSTVLEFVWRDWAKYGESQDSRYPGWDSNRVPPEHKSTQLPLRQPAR